MYRSSSSTRVSDEFFSHQSSTTDTEQLPIYNPESEPAKKEKNRFRSAETAVHIIPLLLVLCAVILWFFSSPEFIFHTAVDIVKKGNLLVTKVEA